MRVAIAGDTRSLTPAADSGVKLVLAGGKGWYYDAIFDEVSALGLTDAVIFPGFISPAELPDWYRGAEAFVYPFRGFFFAFAVTQCNALPEHGVTAIHQGQGCQNRH